MRKQLESVIDLRMIEYENLYYNSKKEKEPLNWWCDKISALAQKATEQLKLCTVLKVVPKWNKGGQTQLDPLCAIGGKPNAGWHYQVLKN